MNRQQSRSTDAGDVRADDRHTAMPWAEVGVIAFLDVEALEQLLR